MIRQSYSHWLVSCPSQRSQKQPVKWPSQPVAEGKLIFFHFFREINKLCLIDAAVAEEVVAVAAEAVSVVAVGAVSVVVAEGKLLL